MRIGVLSDTHIHPSSTIRDNDPFSSHKLAFYDCGCGIGDLINSTMVSASAMATEKGRKA
jgi:predicted phosphodiesterase